MEQLGHALKTPESKSLFYQDFLRVEKLVQQHNQSVAYASQQEYAFLTSVPVSLGALVEDETLYQQQLQLSQILEQATSYEHARQLLQTSPLAHSDWNIENWEPHMLETAISLAKKWKKKE
ncbi:hypothetical protein [Rufibacter immobilis]|uniref:hypothetical protein n=1 Tax=Rufibacter immobilis TaxID=1348778 RepID=UPI0035E977AD